MTDREYQGTRELGNSQGILEMLKKKKKSKGPTETNSNKTKYLNAISV